MGIKIRTKTENGVTTVSVRMPHPMETGRRRSLETDELVPIHHIREVYCDLNGTRVMTAVLGAGISTNPYLSFHLYDSKPGDILMLSWLDNLGDTDTIKTILKGSSD